LQGIDEVAATWKYRLRISPSEQLTAPIGEQTAIIKFEVAAASGEQNR